MPIKPEVRMAAGPAILQLQLCKLSRLLEWDAPSLRAPFWRCYCPLTEGGLVVWQRQTFRLIPGEGLLIAPYTDFRARSLQPFTKAYCHFSYEIPRARTMPGVHLFALDREAFKALTGLAEAEPGRQQSLRLQTLLLEQVAHGLAKIPMPAAEPAAADKRIQAAVELMKQNLASPLSNAKLAAAVNLHENSFVRLFRRVAGEPPQHRYRRLRLEHACYLLIATDQSIDQVAAECGFWDRNHFTRAFRRQWREPPGAFRKQNR